MKARHRIVVGVLVGALGQGAALASERPVHDGHWVIANEGSIGDKWMLSDGTTLATAAYPPGLAIRGDDVCIALGYRIDEDGNTSDFAVLKQWNSATGNREPVDGYWHSFAQAGADAVSQWKFKPRPGARVMRGMYTVATMAFTAAPPAAGKATSSDVMGHCRIDDLAHLLQQQRSRYVMDYSRLRRDVEQARRNMPPSSLPIRPPQRPPQPPPPPPPAPAPLG